MTAEELNIRLFQDEIPHYTYSIGSEEEQRLCLISENGAWLVFYNESGERMDITQHSSEADACADMLSRLE